MILRPNKADLFVLEEPDYKQILDSHYGDFRQQYLSRPTNKTCAFPIWVDFGAHIGTAASKIAHAGAELIYAFEPEPFNYAILAKNIQEFADIIPLNYGVIGSNLKTKRELFYVNLGVNTGRHTLASSLSETHEVVELDIPLLPFNYILKSTGAICAKIDIEGAEHTFIYELLRSQLEFVIMEYHYSDAIKQHFPDAISVEELDKRASANGWALLEHSKDEKYQTSVLLLTRI